MYQNGGTRSIVVNSAEEPDYIPHPELDPTGYDHYDRRAMRPRRSYWKVWVVCSVLFFLVSVIACFAIKAFFEYRYSYDTTFHTIVDTGMNIAVGAVFLAVAAAVLFAAGGLLNIMLKLGVLELPGGVVVHIFDLVLDWRRARSRQLAEWAVGRHYDVQRVLAEKSVYRNVTTYSPAVHYSTRVEDFGGGDGDQNVSSIVVPPFAELMQNGIIGGDNGLMLGIAADEE